MKKLTPDMKKLIKKFISKIWFKKKSLKTDVPNTQHHEPLVLTLKIHHSGEIESNLNKETIKQLNEQAISQMCKMMSYVAILEMHSQGRTLH